MTLTISTALFQAILTEMRAAAPAECCGLLLGDPADGTVADILPAANVAADPRHRFEIDPAMLLRAHRAAREGGPAILGHYHSHPAGDSAPSATDAAMAEARGEYWLIIGADETARAWRAGSSGALYGRFEPVKLTVSAHPPLARPGAARH